MWPSRRQWRSWSLPSKLTAIGTGVSAIALVFSVAVWLTSRSCSPVADRASGLTGAPPAESPPDASRPSEAPRLPEEVIRNQIRGALGPTGEGVGEAIRLWKGLEAGPAQEEECDHILEYCIKNPSKEALEQASVLAKACWVGTVLKGRQQKIDLARLRLR